MKRTASAEWAGELKAGAGTISTASGTLAETPYSFHTRFENGFTLPRNNDNDTPQFSAD
jgi:osmotically inducible protein OsmC